MNAPPISWVPMTWAIEHNGRVAFLTGAEEAAVRRMVAGGATIKEIMDAVPCPKRNAYVHICRARQKLRQIGLDIRVPVRGFDRVYSVTAAS